MSGEVSYQSMYDLGYNDALEEIRDLIWERLKEIKEIEIDSSRYSYFSGMRDALRSISEEAYKMEE